MAVLVVVALKGERAIDVDRDCAVGIELSGVLEIGNWSWSGLQQLYVGYFHLVVVTVVVSQSDQLLASESAVHSRVRMGDTNTRETV